MKRQCPNPYCREGQVLHPRRWLSERRSDRCPACHGASVIDETDEDLRAVGIILADVTDEDLRSSPFLVVT